MNDASKQPPRFVPTLTDVVPVPDAPEAAPTPTPTWRIDDVLVARRGALELPNPADLPALPEALPPQEPLTTPGQISGVIWKSASGAAIATVVNDTMSSPPVQPAAAAVPDVELPAHAAQPMLGQAEPAPQSTGVQAADSDWQAQWTQRVMEQVDMLLQERVQQAIAQAVQAQSQVLAQRLQQDIEAVVREAVSQAVAQALPQAVAPAGEPPQAH